MIYSKLKIISLFLLLIFNYSYSQNNKNNKNFPKYTSSEKRSIGYEKRLEIENSSIVKNIPFRNIGPTVMSGRVSDLEVNPQDPSNFYVAYASGGLWETTNNGNSFNSIFDNQMVMTIGDIAVDWVNNIIYVGTGEKNSSRSSYSGNGIYRSTDNGNTWEHLGLDESVGSGITKVPEAEPVESVVKAEPAELPVGVTKLDMSIPSKKGKILVSGFISSAWNEIVFGLINEAKASAWKRLSSSVSSDGDSPSSFWIEFWFLWN